MSGKPENVQARQPNSPPPPGGGGGGGRDSFVRSCSDEACPDAACPDAVSRMIRR